ncbi:methionine--tRNA ligase [Candidatus Peregrinibacteria bacterium]|nr:methionine--tRNA ligase [Candidatus Peregrinibacteria bacterium]MBI3816254.1 methionine--tRNA ligase [Candidatus Peregrinibacteria bacterium]
MPRQYIHTAIDFPNAAPHMGHVMEKVLADVMARWFRLRGDEVRLHVGADENGIKIQQTAEALGMTPQELVDRNSPLFEQLFRRLNISFDTFIRTSDPKRHWPTVVALWNRLKEGGFLEKRTYAGLYCTGCERFVTEKDLVDGLCPDHRQRPEAVKEENWFFLLSRKQDAMKKLLHPKTGTYKMVPSWRGNEVLSFLEGGLEDVSFSRSKETLSWGVPVPDEPDQVMYVWCDNLTSYLSSLGFFTDHEMREWWDDAEITDVIGKDIARFHAINWPAMLQCAGVKTPERLLIHGFITSDGQKMSKTLGNVVVPSDVLDRYGVDPLRFYLSHEIPVGNDGDFSWKRFGELYDAKLRNQLGNLLNRALVLLKKEGGEMKLGAAAQAFSPDSWGRYVKAMNDFDYSVAIQEAFSVVAASNQGFNDAAVWTIADKATKIETLSAFAEILRHVALMLLPFMPETAQRMSRQLNVPYVDQMLDRSFVLTDEMKDWGSQKEWKRVGEPEILFPPVECK